MDTSKLTQKQIVKFLEQVDAYEAKPAPYEPHPKQRVFHESTRDWTLAIAGNRGGKSSAGAQETVWRALGIHPYKKTRVPIKIWVGSYDFPNGIAKIALPKIMSLLEPRQINSTRKNSQGIMDHIELINDTTIDFKSYEQDSMKWEGEDIDYIWLDEPPPREHFIAANRGLVDRDGQGCITATPLREPWVHEELWEPGITGANDNVCCVSWSSYDNPHIDHAAMRKFEAKLSPEDRKVRIYGEFKQLIGRVFGRFQKKEPWVIPWYQWPRKWRYVECLDPHISKAHGFLRFGITETPSRDVVVFYCSRPTGNMDELGKHIIETRPPNSEPLLTIADTSLAIYDQNMGVTMQERLERAGVPTQSAYKKNQLIPGIENLQQMIYRSEIGEPHGLYVMETCVELIEEMMRYRWDEKKEEVPKGVDDLIDSLRYGCSLEPWELEEQGQLWHRPSPVTYDPKPEKRDHRGYSNASFDMDEDEDDDEVNEFTVRY